jgi:hypothetical protein
MKEINYQKKKKRNYFSTIIRLFLYTKRFTKTPMTARLSLHVKHSVSFKTMMLRDHFNNTSLRILKPFWRFILDEGLMTLRLRRFIKCMDTTQKHWKEAILISKYKRKIVKNVMIMQFSFYLNKVKSMPTSKREILEPKLNMFDWGIADKVID